MFRKAGTTASVAILLAVAGCGGDQQGDQQRDPDADARAPEETVAEGNRAVEQTAVAWGTTVERTAPERTTPDAVSVGGFSVEGPDGDKTTVPEVTVEREEAQRYEGQVRPVIDDTVRDVSDLVQTDVRLENGDLSLDVEVTSLKEARASVRDGLERLQGIDPPEGLEPVHQRLIEAYEQALPAYDEIIGAAESGDPQRMSAAVGENLPRIESFNEETRAISQDLERATASQRQ